MSASTKRIVVAVLFIVVGLPPGLCSLYFAPAAIGMLNASSADARVYGGLFLVPCLIGLVVFAGLLSLLILTWRRTSP